jgi:hypothetical protein
MPLPLPKLPLPLPPLPLPNKPLPKPLHNKLVNKPLHRPLRNKRVRLGLCKALLFLHPALLHPAFRVLVLLCLLQPHYLLLAVLRSLLLLLLELMLWVCLMLRRVE